MTSSWADKIVGGIKDVGSVTDAFRDALDGSARERLTKDDLHHSGFRIAPDHSCFVAVRQSGPAAPVPIPI